MFYRRFFARAFLQQLHLELFSHDLFRPHRRRIPHPCPLHSQFPLRALSPSGRDNWKGHQFSFPGRLWYDFLRLILLLPLLLLRDILLASPLMTHHGRNLPFRTANRPETEEWETRNGENSFRNRISSWGILRHSSSIWDGFEFALMRESWKWHWRDFNLIREIILSAFYDVQDQDIHSNPELHISWISCNWR